MTTILRCGVRSFRCLATSSTVYQQLGSSPIAFTGSTKTNDLFYLHHQIPLRQSSTVTRINHDPLINPPSSTLPPPMVLPSRSPSQSTFAYYFSLGRAYLDFYKTGAKAVYTNFQESQAIVARLPPSLPIPDALSQNLLSRGEWQLIRRSRQDIAKVPPFALVFMICGEFTPLVILFLGGVVPRTCMIPKQIGVMRQKAEERRQRSFRGGSLQSDQVSSTIEGLRHGELQHIGRSLGLYSKLWDTLIGGAPALLMKRRAQKRLEYLDLDDMAITRDGGVKRMEIEEVRIALEERGVDVLSKNDNTLQTQLQMWLKVRKFQPTTRLLVTRPSVWQEIKQRMS